MDYSKYFKGKIAFVTGGGEGLGQSLCLKLAEYNAIVICTDKDASLAENTITLIKSQTHNNSSQSFQMDVTENNQITSVLSKIYSTFGKIDYFFNNAGITIGGEIRDLTIEHWKKVIDVNLIGLLTCSSEVFRHMSKAKQGHIINITSISGLLEYTALGAPYAVSKHGAVTFSKALRLEALDFNVKVTTVCPGSIKTKIAEKMEYINSSENMRQQSIDFIEKGIAPETASQIILNGVIQNKKVIVFPTSFRIYYFLTKIFGFFERSMALKMTRNFRENNRLR